MHAPKLALVIILSALATATNYILIGLPNVVLMDFIVFIGGFLLGPVSGALIGVLSWSAYGVLNPYGFVPSIWVATMLCESVYGIVGGILGRSWKRDQYEAAWVSSSILFAFVGFLLTMTYDVLTNIVYSITFDVPISVVLIVGIPFTVVHGVSNAAIFGLGSLPAARTATRLLGDK